MTAEKLRYQLEIKLQEITTLKDKQMELEGRIARLTKQVCSDGVISLCAGF